MQANFINTHKKNNLRELQQAYKLLSYEELLQELQDKQNEKSQKEKQFIKLLLFCHENTINHIKNQSHLLKKIFTYENTKLLISFLVKEHSNIYGESQALNDKNNQLQPSNYTEIQAFSRFRDITEQQYPLQFKIPYAAKQIFSSQCHHISELLFQGQKQNENQTSAEEQYPLFLELLKFFDKKEHYLLAGYFSKVMMAITKRVFSPNHKYNSFFCRCIFQPIQNDQKEQDTDNSKKSYLFKSLHHFYSISTLDYVIKWLGLVQKVKVNQNEDQQLSSKVSTILDYKKDTKQNFLGYLLQILNQRCQNEEILTNIVQLFKLLFEQSNNNSLISSSSIKLPSSLSLGSQKFDNKPKKITPYDIATETKLLKVILQPIQFNSISVSKIKLIKCLILKYKDESSKYQQSRYHKSGRETNSNYDNEESIQYKIFTNVQLQDIQQLMIWIFQLIKKLLYSETKNAQSGIVEKQIIFQKKDNMLLLNLLQLLWEIQTLNIMQTFVYQYYTQNCDQIIETVVTIMKSCNNIIQLAQSKIIKLILTGNRQIKSNDNSSKKSKELKYINFTFVIKLLMEGIPQLIHLKNVKQHIIIWAQIIMGWPHEYIFENQQEQYQWSYLHKLVENARQIVIGQAKYNPQKLEFFYSKDKARSYYADFALGFKVQVEYESKVNEQKAQIIKLSAQNEVETSYIQNTVKFSDSKMQHIDQNINYISMESQSSKSQEIQKEQLCYENLKSACYLTFDIEELMQDLI